MKAAGYEDSGRSSRQTFHLGLGLVLTMFLKWALRVPVAWWYSITQQLFRISPLHSLPSRWEPVSTGPGPGAPSCMHPGPQLLRKAPQQPLTPPLRTFF